MTISGFECTFSTFIMNAIMFLVHSMTLILKSLYALFNANFFKKIKFNNSETKNL